MGEWEGMGGGEGRGRTSTSCGFFGEDVGSSCNGCICSVECLLQYGEAFDKTFEGGGGSVGGRRWRGDGSVGGRGGRGRLRLATIQFHITPLPPTLIGV